MTKAKKLIEVAMPIKEISAESVRDKYIHDGHISTLHIWWARRPLALSRAIIFASIVPDPLDAVCSDAFKEAVSNLLSADCYTPYGDIPYTASYDKMDDNLRTRLMMFIGKFSHQYITKTKLGESVAPGDILDSSSLIKWENKNNPEVLNIAQELIYVAYNSEINPDKTYRELSSEFKFAKKKIYQAEDTLYNYPDRHIKNEFIASLEKDLQDAIQDFQNNMPIVFDPFAGGGAIPIEAARLGCRSFGNDINPVAHIIEKASATYPQLYAKPISYSIQEFENIYGDEGIALLDEKGIQHFGDKINIPNRLSFDVEYYSRKLLTVTQNEVGDLYETYSTGTKPVVYYWARVAKCSNPSCRAEVPMMKQFYLANKKSKQVYLDPIISGNQINFQIASGSCKIKPWNNRGNITCPCCGNITRIDDVKEQSIKGQLKSRLLAVIYDNGKGKTYEVVNEAQDYTPKYENYGEIETARMQRNSGGGDTFSWGINKWYQLYSRRQLDILYTLNNNIKNIIKGESDYNNVLRTYLAIFVDRVCAYSSTFGRWIPQNEQATSLFARQAIAMNSDYPEINIFSKSTSGAYNQLDWIIRYLNSEGVSPFSVTFKNASSGEKNQFAPKELTAVITDPPYYNAIAYADISDYFYIWLKNALSEIYPDNFSTPQTPKTEECTALKHHHNNSEEEAKKFFEKKLTSIFDAIEAQTSGVVSIMFAHQSTEAWTTLCNSILDARMNISGSWAIDSERDTRMVANAGSALESSVTVACRPSERKGFGDYKDVKKAIAKKVEEEVNYLYNLGFRGADLLTACFGQAVSEFGKYQIVEKADGSEVQVSELLEMARESAFDALLKGVQGDDFTRFYVGWLQLNGMGETDFDDVTKFTRVGLNVNITDIFAKKLLIRNGKSQHLASAEEHIGGNQLAGMNSGDILIEQVHRAILLYRAENRSGLLNQLKRINAGEITAPFWRLLASLKELLPANDDLKQVQGLLANGEDLRQSCKNYDETVEQAQLSFDF